MIDRRSPGASRSHQKPATRTDDFTSGRVPQVIAIGFKDDGHPVVDGLEATASMVVSGLLSGFVDDSYDGFLDLRCYRLDTLAGKELADDTGQHRADVSLRSE